MNLTILCGRITAEPNIQMTTSGKKVCKFTLAVDDGKNADGSRRTQFIDCDAWNQSAEFLERYVHKGMRILAQGRLNKTSYEKDGQKHYPTTVVCDRLEFADGANQTAQQSTYAQPAQQTQPQYTQPSMMPGNTVPAQVSDDNRFPHDSTYDLPEWSKGIDIGSDDLPF